jgi:16S rRNA (cytosine1402-N4)-methyltransferase
MNQLTTPSALHQSVMLEEALAALGVKPGNWYIDGTFGRGGHTAAILARGGKVVAFDMDHQAIEYGQAKFAQAIADHSLILVRENFDQLERVITELQNQGQVGPIAGILFDFGTSVDQLLDPSRGFSFDSDAELDMRMDNRLGVKAKDLLAILPEKQLAALFQEEGGEQFAKPIAKAIAKTRTNQPITTTKQLAELISKIKPRTGKLHPATKVFQALRIAVNTELSNIAAVLPQAMRVLATGSLVTIAFHEGEDRLVKQFMKEVATSNKITVKDLQQPSTKEQEDNPRARSAKLRVAIKQS